MWAIAWQLLNYALFVFLELYLYVIIIEQDDQDVSAEILDKLSDLVESNREHFDPAVSKNSSRELNVDGDKGVGPAAETDLASLTALRTTSLAGDAAPRVSSISYSRGLERPGSFSTAIRRRASKLNLVRNAKQQLMGQVSAIRSTRSSHADPDEGDSLTDEADVVGQLSDSVVFDRLSVEARRLGSSAVAAEPSRRSVEQNEALLAGPGSFGWDASNADVAGLSEDGGGTATVARWRGNSQRLLAGSIRGGGSSRDMLRKGGSVGPGATRTAPQDGPPGTRGSGRVTSFSTGRAGSGGSIGGGVGGGGSGTKDKPWLQSMLHPLYRYTVRPMYRRMAPSLSEERKERRKKRRDRGGRFKQYYGAWDQSIRGAGFLTAWWCTQMIEFYVRKWVMFLTCTIFLFCVLVLPHVLRSSSSSACKPA